MPSKNSGSVNVKHLHCFYMAKQWFVHGFTLTCFVMEPYTLTHSVSFKPIHTQC